MKHQGDLIVTTDNQDNFKDITEVSDYIYVSENATFQADNLKKSGYIYVSENATFQADNLEEVSGYIKVRANATFQADNLKKSGYIKVSENATFQADNLKKSDSIELSENATLTAPKLAEKLNEIGYNIKGGRLTHGYYLHLTDKEISYLNRIKPLVESDKLVMSKWHENDNWKSQTIDEVIGCGTTHCVAGWIQIFEKDKYNDVTAEECGKKCAPNLASLFFESEEKVELAINTLIQ